MLSIVMGCSSAEQPAADRGASDSADATNAAITTPSDQTGETTPAATSETSLAADPSVDTEKADADISRTAPASVFRIDREPLDLNSERLKASGIHLLQSKRLILLTDRNPDTVRSLPPLADAFFDFLEQACGPLRPSRSGEDFQAIGCLMVDFERFQTAGLVPGSVVSMNHGQQEGYRFWMRDQTEDYYRRHLLLHEFAHVYMTCDTGLADIGDGWFMEGAAEVFATHILHDDSPQFGILPTGFSGMEGWGRISTIRRQRVNGAITQIAEQSIPSLHSVRFPQGALAGDEARYSWWWALSWMLSHHPEYIDEWNALCRSRGAAEFAHLVAEMQHREARLKTDWLLFAESVTEDFDTARSFPLHADSDAAASQTFTLLADRSWQDTGWELKTDDSVELSVSGECVVNTTSAPWTATPIGITLEYNQGRPLGEALAVLVGDDGSWLSQRIVIGDGRTIAAPGPGRLWLQINDSAGSRADNSGHYTVHIRATSSDTSP